MDRGEIGVGRGSEFFSGRVDDVLDMVRQDRQELRGWQEPAHVRAVVRRGIREGASTESAATSVMVAELNAVREAAEPDQGQQREAFGRLLELGAGGLEKVSRGTSAELTAEEILGLECVLLLYGRPALQVSEGRLASVPPFWNLLEDQRED